MNLATPIEKLPGTSFLTLKKLKNIEINNYWELLNYFPFRYENYSIVSPISSLQNGETVTIKGKLIEIENLYSKRGLKIQKAKLADASGQIDLIWYNQPYLLRVLKSGMYLSLAGEVKGFFHSLSFVPKEFDIIRDFGQETIHTGRLIPIYPEKKGLSAKLFREKIHYLIEHHCKGNYQDNLEELLPHDITKKFDLLSESAAYKQIHFPRNLQLAKQARERLAFDELFLIQLSSQIVRRDWEKENVGNAFKMETQSLASLQDFIKNLPFELTSAQKRSTREIISDLRKTKPMNRFLQGDVGSGKTVVAATACYFSYLNGYKSLFMAPTEILAYQHYQTLKKLFAQYQFNIALQTRTMKNFINRKRVSKNNNVKKNKINYDLIIGTHALINQNLEFDKVGLVVIDEQHRFGVVQRAKLKEKGLNPHLLTMTATPIPRTVALTLYGELDISLIDELPQGRKSVKTYLVPKEKRQAGYQWIRKKINSDKAQVFIICPLIEESDVETMKSVKAAKKEFLKLQSDIFPQFRLALLHGKVKTDEKNIIMRDFKVKKYDILVATSLVEVGIDIPSATIMIIEGADRFGLAQLHQLRGRIGRSEKQSYCFLYTESGGASIIEKLKFFAKTNSGIKIAEYDLQRRGPGEVFGTRQHGFLNLKIASLADLDLIEKSRQAVIHFLRNQKFCYTSIT